MTVNGENRGRGREEAPAFFVGYYSMIRTDAPSLEDSIKKYVPWPGLAALFSCILWLSYGGYFLLFCVIGFSYYTYREISNDYKDKLYKYNSEKNALRKKEAAQRLAERKRKEQQRLEEEKKAKEAREEADRKIKEKEFNNSEEGRKLRDQKRREKKAKQREEYKKRRAEAERLKALQDEDIKIRLGKKAQLESGVLKSVWDNSLSSISVALDKMYFSPLSIYSDGSSRGKYYYSVEMSKISPEQRAIGKILEYVSLFTDDNIELFYWKYKLALASNDGTKMATHGASIHTVDIKESVGLKYFNDNVRPHIPSVSSMLGETQKVIRCCMSGDFGEDAKVYVENILGGGNSYITKSSQIKNIDEGERGSELLNLGRFINEDLSYFFTPRTSLISIAAPGSGKTQCHVLPNLNSFEGAAIVLDVKGECYDNSAEWRRANVGSVYAFSPSDPEQSHCYNPLTLMSEDPDEAWQDAKFLADLLIVPKSQNDPTWEAQGKDLLTFALACVAMNPPEKRKMEQVMDLMADIGLEQAFETVTTGEFPSAMRRAAKKFADLKNTSERQWAGVTSAANQHLSVWEGSNVEKVTAKSDWTPSDFRKSPAPTLYLKVPPNAIDTYAPLLRVIIAQHVNELMKEEPSEDAPQILFMLDEMPQLGRMEPIKRALNVGRSYKIQLWMFAQNVGQLQEAYGKETADGMIESCGARIYMNPGPKTAEELSRILGTREDVLSGKTKPVVTPQELMGPEWKDDMLVFTGGEKPLRLKKAFFYEQQES